MLTLPLILAGLLLILFGLMIQCAIRAHRAGGEYPSLCGAILAMLAIFVGIALLLSLLRAPLG